MVSCSSGRSTLPRTGRAVLALALAVTASRPAVTARRPAPPQLAPPSRRRRRPPATPRTANPRPPSSRLPHRHQLRPRRRHRHRQAGQPGRRSQAIRVRGHRGRQAAEHRVVPFRAGRRLRAGRTTRPIRTRDDEERAAANEDARIFVFFLDDYHVRLGNSMAARKPLSEFVQNRLAPGDFVAVMYPLQPIDTVALTRDHQRDPRGRAVRGPEVQLRAEEFDRATLRLYPAETVERIRRQVSLSALEGLAREAGRLR